MAERIKALVVRLLSGDTETGSVFLLGKMETADGFSFCRVSGRGRWVRPGMFISADGAWKTTEGERGKTSVLRARYMRPEMPTRKDSVELFFSSIFTLERHGISGGALRRMLAVEHRHSVESVFMNPGKLIACSDKPDKHASAIIEDLAFYRGVYQGYYAMRHSGMHLDAVDSVMHHIEPEKCLDTVIKDPWVLTKFPGVALDDSDLVAKYFGYDKGDTRRTNATLVGILENLEGGGSTIVSKSEACARLLDIGATEDGLKRYFDENSHSSDITIIDPDGNSAGDGSEPRDQFIALTRLYQAERSIFEFLRSKKWTPNLSRGANRLIADRVLASPDFGRLDDTQRRAVRMAAEEAVAVITGGPGTGKSTILRALVRVYEAVDPKCVLLAAPTGKAAKRLSETTGRSAATVHKLLRARQSSGSGGATVFAVNEFNPLPPRSVIVVDEASMLDAEMAAALVRATPENGRLILSGDKNQLMSVGAGNILDDILSEEGSALVPSVELVNVYRQSANSLIAVGAENIRGGRMPEMASSGDAVFIPADDGEIADITEDLVARILREKKYGPQDIAVLAPMMAGNGGVAQLNQRLSGLLNPNGEPIPNFLARFNDCPEKMQVKIGDRIMLSENDFEHDLVNGDTGAITRYFRGPSNRPVVEVAFDHGKTVEYPLHKWRCLLPAYCLTTHKSQGSQYPVVVLPVARGHAKMLERRLFYTGWTRAQNQVFVVGDEGALYACLRNQGKPRTTALRDILLRSNQAAPRIIVGHNFERTKEIENKLKEIQNDWHANENRRPESLGQPNQTAQTGGGTLDGSAREIRANGRAGFAGMLIKPVPIIGKPENMAPNQNGGPQIEAPVPMGLMKKRLSGRKRGSSEVAPAESEKEPAEGGFEPVFAGR